MFIKVYKAIYLVVSVAYVDTSESTIPQQQKKCALFPPGLEPGTFRARAENS